MIQLLEHFTYKKLIRFTIPTVAMMIFTSIYGVVDGLFVSNIVGSEAFAGVNLIMPALMMLGSGRNFRRIQQRTARYDNQCNLPVCAVIHYKRYQYLCIGILYSAEQRSCFRYNFIFENAGFSNCFHLYSPRTART